MAPKEPYTSHLLSLLRFVRRPVGYAVWGSASSPKGGVLSGTTHASTIRSCDAVGVSPYFLRWGQPVEAVELVAYSRTL